MLPVSPPGRLLQVRQFIETYSIYSPISSIPFGFIMPNLSLCGSAVAGFDRGWDFGDERANVANFETTLMALSWISKGYFVEAAC